MWWIESVRSDGEGRRRHRVRHAQLDVQGIGDHGAEDGDHDHRQPVHPGDVAADGQLEDQGGGESDGAEANSDVWVDLMHRVVRRRLAHGGRQDLEDPEVRCDLRDLPQSPACGAHGAEGTITWTGRREPNSARATAPPRLPAQMV